ncbi:MAG: hypothetical protein CND89_02425 [Marine Group II euryarchaeote MED-G38]|nr:hypothetical protein [Euryarchaeota archaeon]PDH23260.1 MAG: hypothetical protein CND89_02425 [Marine Group II euryarchaeote MED-G38]|tara:strand:+ start:21416 stop:23158 length:1743 start_codon:yes stop_codon:yes gene_type:complete
MFSKMNNSKPIIALLLVTTIMGAPLSGCLEPNDEDLSADSLLIEIIDNEIAQGGFFQDFKFRSTSDMSIFIPYLIKDEITGYIQNSTIFDLPSGETKELSILVPPRIESMIFMIGEEERKYWPIRGDDESWNSWKDRAGNTGNSNNGVERVTADGNNSHDYVNNSINTGGPVIFKSIFIERSMSVGVPEGGVYSTGLVDGRAVYDRLYEITDPTDSFDIIDGKNGYYDRWAGQGNPAYEDAALYLIDELTDFGLDVISHRFEFTDIFGNQNPESYNVCAYKWGSEVTNEWLVFGAHFDVAPPANAVLLDPHITGQRTYGTRVGAYDNSAGTSMVLEAARALSEFESRRTMVFCLWSGEEGGKRGSDYWTDYYVKEDNPDVVVTNYINLDMAGVNWPGGGGAPHGDPDPAIDEDGYPKDDEVWPMRVYIGPGPNHDKLDQPEMVGLSNWIGSDALGLEEQMGTLVGLNYTAETWKTNVWLDMDRPEIIVYEDTTARSDHASFQDNLGTVTVGYGGLVDGYWCYHQTCDTLEEMEEWMDTMGKGYGDENTGVANLVNSLDMITWWALLTFFHCDESPVLNNI